MTFVSHGELEQLRKNQHRHVGATVELHASTGLMAAAWVPHATDVHPRADTIAVATNWLWGRSRVEGLPPILVSNAWNAANRVHAALDEIARTGEHATPQSRRKRYARGPVLALTPNRRALHFAMKLAWGSSLAVVEGSNALTEWAAGATALNLLTWQTTTSQLAANVLNDLDLVIVHGSNDGWRGREERDRVRRYLRRHVSSGALEAHQAAAYALSSQSVSDHAAKRLYDLLRH